MTRRSHLVVGGLILSLVLVALAVPNAFADDPGVPGPFPVTTEEYDFGDTAFNPGTFPGPAEVRASVHYPTGLPGGPFPLVVFLHGRHATCYSGGSAFLEWPCTGGRLPIPSYQGYDYVGTVLASHGYVVVSISANGINARDNGLFDLGMQWRAELMQDHLNRWNTWATTGGPPFGTKFVGKVDMQNIGTMGHSRGGEGVARHFLHNQLLGSPYGITAVFPLAPVDFNRPVINGVPLAVLLPYCDGDVSDLQGVHFYDDARYALPGDTTRKHYHLVMGANHNFYNTIWTPGLFPAGTADDWSAFVPGGFSDPHCGPGMPRRLTASQQRGTGLAYLTAFFRTYVGGEPAFLPILKGDQGPPPSAITSDIHTSYHAPDTAADRRDVNRLLTAAELTTNTLGGAVTRSKITPYDLCGGEPPQPQHCLSQPNSRMPHTTPSARSPKRGLSQLRAGWSSSTAFIQNDLPAGTRNVSGFFALTFRTGVNFEDGRNPVSSTQDFRVILTDGTGASASADVNDVLPNKLFYPPGGPAVTPLPKAILNTVRIPLATFAGVDLTDIRSVRFAFNQTGSGALLISDIAFADSGGGPPPTPDIAGSLAISGTPVVGATMRLRSKATGEKTTTTTDDTGGYQFDPVAPGLYKIHSKTALVVGSTSTVSGDLAVQGAPSVGTKVKLKDLIARTAVKTTTGADGSFSFAGVAPGRYKVIIPRVTVP